jgi:hypothetical protein
MGRFMDYCGSKFFERRCFKENKTLIEYARPWVTDRLINDRLGTFSLDAYYLIERGQILASSAYVGASVALSAGALVAALELVRILA